MSQTLQNFAGIQKCQLDNLVDFEKCCKTRIFLQTLVQIQPKTSEILPKNWQLPILRQRAAILRRVPEAEFGPELGGAVLADSQVPTLSAKFRKLLRNSKEILKNI